MMLIEDRLIAYADAKRAEYRELQEVIHELSTLLEEHPLHPNRLSQCDAIIEHLDQLRRRLAMHIEHEEEGGYLEEAVIQAPHLAPHAERLLAQNKQLMERLETLVDTSVAVRRRSTPLAGWCEEAQALLQDMLALKEREHQFVDRAFNLGGASLY